MWLQVLFIAQLICGSVVSVYDFVNDLWFPVYVCLVVVVVAFSFGGVRAGTLIGQPNHRERARPRLVKIDHHTKYRDRFFTNGISTTVLLHFFSLLCCVSLFFTGFG